MSSTYSASKHVSDQDRVIMEGPGPYRCPRCPVQLPRVEFVKHLWLEHRLVLDGQAVREPWRLIKEWAEEYSRSGNPELLARCQAFGARLDPDQGRLRVQSVLLAQGIPDQRGRQALFAEAGRRRVSVCPRCFAFINAPEEVATQPLDLSSCPPTSPRAPPPVREGLGRGGKEERGLGCRLTKNGYRVEVDDSGLFSKLVIETPKQLLYRGWEPGQRLTFAGAVFFLAGSFTFTALLLALFFPFEEMSPLGPVAFLLLCSLAGFFLARWIWRGSTLDRAVNYAWTMLVFRLEASGYDPEDFAFLASLAVSSVGHGQPTIRAANLGRLVKNLEKAVAEGAVPVTHLAALWRLILADKTQMGEDAAPLAVAQAGRSFAGDLPLSFAENLVTPISETADSWGLPQQNRLRILLCERAFEAGFEVQDLTAIAKAAPFLGQALQTSDLDGLAGLRLLWSLRPRRPWDQLGLVETAFDLAARGENAVLDKYPDVLLAAADGSELYLCTRGVIFQNQVFARPPRSIEVIRKGLFRGFELVIDDRRFHYPQDSDSTACGLTIAKIESWFRYYFGDWVPRVKDVRSWRSPGLPANFRLRKTYPCPECGRELCPRLGDLALLREEMPG